MNRYSGDEVVVREILKQLMKQRQDTEKGGGFFGFELKNKTYRILDEIEGWEEETGEIWWEKRIDSIGKHRQWWSAQQNQKTKHAREKIWWGFWEGWSFGLRQVHMVVKTAEKGDEFFDFGL